MKLMCVLLVIAAVIMVAVNFSKPARANNWCFPPPPPRVKDYRAPVNKMEPDQRVVV